MSARLSPASTLLRQSKLFALPPTISLPPVPPSSDQISRSDTATTIHPIHAAISTPPDSLSRGDWGFKRALPQKAFQKNGNPVVRLVRGIDTPEHIADFESASDHVLTLRKFMELGMPIEHARVRRQGYDEERIDNGVFREGWDETTTVNTRKTVAGDAEGERSLDGTRSSGTGVWPDVKKEEVLNTARMPSRVKKATEAYEAMKKERGSDLNAGPSALMDALSTSARVRAKREVRRWRYDGPSLVQMSGQEFEEYLAALGSAEREILLERVKKAMVQERNTKARDEGSLGGDRRESEVSEEQVNEYLRYLRSEPRKFGPLIAEMLDMPEGVAPKGNTDGEVWEYGRDTLASPRWQESGPPRTHPSAGLSYVHTNAISVNDPKHGPQKSRSAVMARAVKIRTRANGPEPTLGVAGFVVGKVEDASYKRNDQMRERGGLKVPVVPGSTSISVQGALDMRVTRVSEWVNVDEKAVPAHEVRENERQKALKEMYEQSDPSTRDTSGSREAGRQDIGNILEAMGRYKR